ncbi:MAG TPA: DUF5985 family protein [Terriglobales bacterium]|nr:DUF5985 family protein [Terriglobales bacterium]
MVSAVYIVGALVTLVCGILLLRGYVRTRTKLLLWSGICFLGLALSNGLVFVDLVMLPETDLYIARLATAAVAMMILLYGLVFEGES